MRSRVFTCISFSQLNAVQTSHMLSSRLSTRLVLLLVMFVYLSINSIAASHTSLASNSVPCLRTGLPHRPSLLILPRQSFSSRSTPYRHPPNIIHGFGDAHLTQSIPQFWTIYAYIPQRYMRTAQGQFTQVPSYRRTQSLLLSRRSSRKFLLQLNRRMMKYS